MTSVATHEGALSLRGLTKRFAAFAAVDGIDLEVRPGQLMALLGPSGCGKTTTLRMVAGLEQPTGGEICFGNSTFVSTADEIEVSTHRRNIGMVFQSYALWPHMTVFQNVAYPLSVRKVASAEIKRRVCAVLELMELGALIDKTIPQLSGGQQQRVALARALVYEPSLMLFDEPFSNLDVHLRAQMRMELKRLRRKVTMTGLFVTHDQAEALSVADSIAIMHGGRIQQVGAPQDIYKRPATKFVRDFLGRVLSLHGSYDAAGGEARVRLADGTMLSCDAPESNPGSRVEVSIRPEFVKFYEDGEPARANTVTGTIEELLFTGDRFETRLHLGGEHVFTELPAGRPWHEGDAIRLELPMAALSVWPDK
ncbi:MAG TPA: ABC transporter ATP-binding protein [Alphaproteobacteria bacterium]|jgi:ABC-type Fe3+/spermidine/putrescine transport system ATPase subunit